MTLLAQKSALEQAIALIQPLTVSFDTSIDSRVLIEATTGIWKLEKALIDVTQLIEWEALEAERNAV
jgi:hypothetical protein